jgi:hypothetical protein
MTFEDSVVTSNVVLAERMNLFTPSSFVKVSFGKGIFI